MQSAWRSDDFTPQARIRLAAVELFAERGYDRTTVRAVADRAGASASLVMHHFGSKDGLREACDEWVMGFIENEKTDFVVGGSLPQMQAYLTDHPELTALMNYVVASLRHGGPLAQNIFDRMCEATEAMYREGVPAGTFNEPTDREASIATLVAFSAGASLLGPFIARRLGGDSLLDPDVYRRYALAAVELLTHGMFSTDQFLEAATVSADPSQPAR